MDTRALTRLLREKGVLQAALSTDGRCSVEELLALARGWEGLDGRDLVSEVTCQEAYHWLDADGCGVDAGAGGQRQGPRAAACTCAWQRCNPALTPARCRTSWRMTLASSTTFCAGWRQHGLRVTVVPAHTPAEEVLALEPDGIFLSNGPGDPAGVPYAAQAVATLLESKKPMFGICLGHQIIGLALGAKTYKLKFGHHGSNQPVSDVDATNVQITAQNHNYAVDDSTLPANVEVTHRNLNDGTVEGLRLTDRPVFCVQYHPEASPGPHDADLLFADLPRAMKRHVRTVNTTKSAGGR